MWNAFVRWLSLSQPKARVGMDSPPFDAVRYDYERECG